MNTAVPMVWGMGPKYGLQESSRLTPSDRLRPGDGRTARMGPVSGRPACSRSRRPLPSRSLACAVSFGCLSFQCFPFLVCTSCRGRETTPPVDAAWLASNGSNPATLMSCYRSRFAGGSRMASRFNVGFDRGGYLHLPPNLRWVVRSLAADRMTLRCHRLPGPGSRPWPCPSACGQRP